uniref:Uncharacterized protein n=1 Tax=Terrapene triunguis TaxID=2587831 RepID=A0A674IHN4_9SAUR
MWIGWSDFKKKILGTLEHRTDVSCGMDSPVPATFLTLFSVVLWGLRV